MRDFFVAGRLSVIRNVTAAVMLLYSASLFAQDGVRYVETRRLDKDGVETKGSGETRRYTFAGNDISYSLGDSLTVTYVYHHNADGYKVYYRYSYDSEAARSVMDDDDVLHVANDMATIENLLLHNRKRMQTSVYERKDK